MEFISSEFVSRFHLSNDFRLWISSARDGGEAPD